jgi:hypothetical protein
LAQRIEEQVTRSGQAATHHQHGWVKQGHRNSQGVRQRIDCLYPDLNGCGVAFSATAAHLGRVHSCLGSCPRIGYLRVALRYGLTSGYRIQTSSLATPARPALGPDHDVAQLTGAPMGTGERLAIDHHRATDTGADRHEQEQVMPLTGTQPRLRHAA